MIGGQLGGMVTGGITGGAISVVLDLKTGTFSKELHKAHAEAKDFQSTFTGYGNLAVSTGKRFTLGLTTPILAGFGHIINSAREYESAFTSVRKTTDATEAQFAELSDGFRKLSREIPITAVEIAHIGEAAGQLGIRVENIESFTKVMANLGVATNMSSTEAATSLARLANITGMSQKDFDRLGSTIVALGNNLATTESEIVEMSLRLAGAGRQIGLTEAEILALAGSLSSVGIHAQAGGTAFSKVMAQMQLAVETNSDSLEEYAHVANVSISEFSRLFREDAVSAIMMFIDGLSDTERLGETAIKVLNDMGIKEIRMRDALLRSTNARDIYNDAIALGTKAWEENIALTKEAEERYATTDSQIQIAKNKFTDLSITLGNHLLPHINNLMDTLGGLAERFGEMSEEEQKAVLKTMALVAGIGPLLMVGGNLMKIIGGIAGVMKGFGTATTVATTAVGEGVATTGLFAKAVGALSSPIGLGVIALGAIGVATHNWTKKVIENEERVAKWGENVSAETAKALDVFTEHSITANAELERLYLAREEITYENTRKIIHHYDEMKDQVMGIIENQEEQVLTLMRDGNSDLLLETEQYYETRKTETEQKHAEINEIIARAEAEARELTEAERRHLNIRTKQLTDEGIQIISDGEVAMEKLMLEASKGKSAIHKEYMDRVVETSKQMTEELVQQAEENYEEQLRIAIALEREGTESSKRRAEEVRRLAEESKNEELRIIDERMQGIVQRLNKEAGETVAIYDQKNGQIITKEDIFSRNILGKKINLSKDELYHLKQWAESEGLVYDHRTQTIMTKEEQIRRAMQNSSNTAQSSSKTQQTAYKDIANAVELNLSKSLSWIKEYNSTPLHSKSATVSTHNITTYETRNKNVTISPYATGTPASRGGLALVGEMGAELVELPAGSRVHTAGATRGMTQIDYDLLGNKVAEALEKTEIIAKSYIGKREITDIVGAELARRSRAY